VKDKSLRIDKLLSDKDKFKQIDKHMNAQASADVVKWSNKKAALRSRMKKRDENEYLIKYVENQDAYIDELQKLVSQKNLSIRDILFEE
jgi:alpha-acetolactate decarboxylase